MSTAATPKARPGQQFYPPTAPRYGANKGPNEQSHGPARRPSQLATPRPLQWLARSKIMAVIWTTMRVWFGAVWIQAGATKLWGAENPAFLHHNGAGVAGFATHGVAAYTWGSFLHSFVVLNAAPMGVFIAVAEFAIGIALVLGLLTPWARWAAWPCSSPTSCRARPACVRSMPCSPSSSWPPGGPRAGSASTGSSGATSSAAAPAGYGPRRHRS